GYDAIRLVRNVLPQTRIVYTLHEFLPICHRGGQLLRTGTDEPCLEESPRRCHECFPTSAPTSSFCESTGSSHSSPWWIASSPRAGSCSSVTSTGGFRGRSSASRI